MSGSRIVLNRIIRQKENTWRHWSLSLETFLAEPNAYPIFHCPLLGSPHNPFGGRTKHGGWANITPDISWQGVSVAVQINRSLVQCCMAAQVKSGPGFLGNSVMLACVGHVSLVSGMNKMP
jgi:hypothetical protein